MNKAQMFIQEPPAGSSSTNEYSVVIASKKNNKGMKPGEIDKVIFDEYLKNPVVLWEHSSHQNVPIGKTTDLRRNGEGDLVATFQFLDGDDFAQRVRNAWDSGFVRSASVGWDYNDSGDPVLLEWSIVSIPMDPNAIRNSYQTMLTATIGEIPQRGELTMDTIQTAVRDVIKDVLGSDKSQASAGDEGKPLITDDQIDRLAKGLAGIRWEQREESQASKEPEQKASKEEEQPDINKVASERASLIVSVREILDEKFEIEKASNREIIIAALGDTVKEADKKSDDYLQARLDSMLEERNGASSKLESLDGKASSHKTSYETIKSLARGGTASLLRLRRRRQASK